MALSYSWLGQELALDLANTVIEEIDGLATSGDLRRWLDLECERLGAAPGAEERLRDFRDLRDGVRALLTAAANGGELPTSAVAALNRASEAAPSFVQLQAPADVVVEWRAATPVDRVRGALAASAIDLLGGPERDRIRVCGAPRCGLFFLASREQQQWCSPTCGNRARVARHYARRARRA